VKPGKLVILLAVFALALAACGGDEIAEQIIESQDGVGDIEIDQNDGTVAITIQGDDGEDSVAVFGGGEVPSDFPIPVPGGGDVGAIIETEGNTSLTLVYPMSEFDTLSQFYENWANDAGEVQFSTASSDPRLSSWVVQSGTANYTVTVSEGNDRTVVSLTSIPEG
jgi:hypothetical protein